ncbi:hypothetical protein, partial [Vibrio mediterranei]|uniref:hypothetical protein n=1 Tax=Vibrio mediterranei TaxID=689 RepID=UPI0022840C72
MLSENNLSLLRLENHNETFLYLTRYDEYLKAYHEHHGINVTEIHTITLEDAGSHDAITSLINFVVDQIQSKGPTRIPRDSVFIERHSTFRTFRTQYEFEVVQLMNLTMKSVADYPSCWSGARDAHK